MRLPTKWELWLVNIRVNQIKAENEKLKSEVEQLKQQLYYYQTKDSLC